MTDDYTLVLNYGETTALLDWIDELVQLPMSDGGSNWTGGFDLLVRTTAYTSRIDPEWCRFLRRAAGTAAMYPYRVQIPDHGVGQYRRSDILSARVWLPVHPDMPDIIPGERLLLLPTRKEQ